jgi:hypothetical protein
VKETKRGVQRRERERLLWLCFMTRGPDSSVQRQRHKRIKAVTTGLLIVSAVFLLLHSASILAGPRSGIYMQQVRTRVDQRIQAYAWCLLAVSAMFLIILLVEDQEQK